MTHKLLQGTAIVMVLIMSVFFTKTSFSKPKEEFYQIKIYQLGSQEQEEKVDAYLQNAYLPALRRLGITRVGVFKPLANDTAKIRRIYVLVPFKTEKQFVSLPEQLAKDVKYNEDGREYLDASYDQVPYQRIESILLNAFPGMPVLQTPYHNSAGDKDKRIYELRSYEGPTEKYYEKKVHMFNEGGEVEIFRRLGFNPVFFGKVLIGSRMPNLMYMTSFEDMASHDAHWQSFRTDPAWKELSGKDFYKHSVSKSTIILLKATPYSEI